MVKGQKGLIKASVRQSIAALLKDAESAWTLKKPERSKRYAQMAMDLVRKHKVRLTKEQKGLFCRKCLVWWVPGGTVKLVYDKRHHLIRAICQCGHSKRI